MRFFYGDLKRHCLHFLTRREVVQLGRTSKRLNDETMNVSQWPLHMTSLKIRGLVKFVELCRMSPRLLGLSSLELMPQRIDMQSSFDTRDTGCECLRTLHLRLVVIYRDDDVAMQKAIDLMPMWSHTLQHLEVSSVHCPQPWKFSKPLALPQLQTITFRTSPLHVESHAL